MKEEEKRKETDSEENLNRLLLFLVLRQCIGEINFCSVYLLTFPFL